MAKNERNDAWLVTDLDPMHTFMTYIMGDRTDNEAVANIEVEMSALDNYIKEKNRDKTEGKYTYFHAVLAAFARTIEVRPKLNYFIRNNKIWKRKKINFTFIAKKQKVDGAEEGIVISTYNPDSEINSIDQFNHHVTKEVSDLRKSNDSSDATMKIVEIFLKLPGFIVKFIVKLIRFLDNRGRLPKAFESINPYGTTAFIANLGSIGLNASYHHLINFGSNSIFIIIGKKIERDDKFYLPLSFTIDERIADGVYFNNSLKVFKHLLLNPDLLDKPANEKIDFKDVLGK